MMSSLTTIHPELKAGEVFVGNVRDFSKKSDDGTNKYEWKTARVGSLAFDRNGAEIAREDFDVRPVFAAESEILDRGLGFMIDEATRSIAMPEFGRFVTAFIALNACAENFLKAAVGSMDFDLEALKASYNAVSPEIDEIEEKLRAKKIAGEKERGEFSESDISKLLRMLTEAFSADEEQEKRAMTVH